MPLHALVIDNGIGAHRAFHDHPDVIFDHATTGRHFAPDLSRYDLLVVPNGADHIAMSRLRDQVRQFLDDGKTLFCFCGWFLDWIPGHRWIHDNSHPTREMRHFAAADPHGLLKGFDLASLDHNLHGISGWWACGYIEPAEEATVLIRDPWGRALVIADDQTTNGFMFLTASGPVGDYSRSPAWSPLATLYHNVLRYTVARAAGTTAAHKFCVPPSCS